MSRNVQRIGSPSESKPRTERKPKKSGAADDKAGGGTIGDLIKQKLGDKLSLDKDEKE